MGEREATHRRSEGQGVSNLNPLDVMIRAKDQASAAFARTQKGIQSWALAAKGRAYEVQRSFAALTGGIGLLQMALGGLTIGAMVRFVSQAISAAESLDKISQSAAVSVEELSTMNYVVGRSGSSAEALQNSLVRLNVKLVEAGNGSKRMRQTFSDLGVEFESAPGKIRPTMDVLRDMADRFKALEDGPEKTAAAVNIFGKAGAELIPTLNLGSKGIAELQERARALGLEISTQTAREAARYKDAIGDLQKSFDGLTTEIAKRALPGLTRVAEAMAKGAIEGGLLQAALEGAVQALNELHLRADRLTGIDALQRDLDELDGQMGELQAKLKGLRGWNARGASDEVRSRILEEYRATVQQLQGMEQLRQDLIQRIAEGVTPADLGGRASEILLAQEDARRRGMGGSRGDDDSLDGEGGGSSAADRRQAERDERELERRREQAARIEQEARLFGATDLERLAAHEEEKLRLVAGFESAEMAVREEYATRREQVHAARRNSERQAVQRGMMALLQTTIAGEGAIFGASKKAQSAMALMNAYQSASQALKNPPGPPFTVPLAAHAFLQAMKAKKGIDSASVGGSGGGASPFGGAGATTPSASQQDIPDLRERDQGPVTKIDLYIQALDSNHAVEILTPALREASRDGRLELTAKQVAG
jgi:hypothetical protein